MDQIDWKVWVIAAEIFVVCLIVCSILLLMLQRGRRENIRLREELEVLVGQRSRDFLERELLHTQQLLNQENSGNDKILAFWKARLEWLSIELDALIENGGYRSDAQLLLRRGPPFVHQLVSPRPERSDDGTQQKSLQQSRAVVALQKELIAQLRARLQVAALADPKTNGVTIFSSETLDSVSDTAHHQLQSIASLEKHLDNTQTGLAQATAEIERLRRQPMTSVTAATHVTNGSPSSAEARKLVEAMRAAHQQSRDELRRMRESNTRQRALIAELDSQLNQVREDSAATAPSQQLLDSLKQQLRDYENCTASLEMETEELRARLTSITRVIDIAEGVGAEAGSPAARDTEELTALRLRSKLFTAAFKRLADIANQAVIKDAVALLNNGFGDPRLIFVVLVISHKENHWLSNQPGPISEDVQRLLQSCVPTPDLSWTEVKDGAIFVGGALRLLLRQGVMTGEAFSQTCKFLTPQLQIIGALMQMLDLRAMDKPATEVNIKVVLQEIIAAEAQREALDRESVRSLVDFQKELSDHLKKLSLTDLQRELLTTMLDEFYAEAMALNNTAAALCAEVKSAIGQATPSLGVS